jgi:hypothetical protein
MFDNTRVCGVEDHLGGSACQWPFLDVLVHAQGSVNGISLADAAEVAIARWNEVCGLRLAMTPTQSKAHIYIIPSRIDGQQNVLADCELPCFSNGVIRQLRCRVDNSENFVLCVGPPPVGKIDVGRVLTHELGHGAIGTGNIENGNLMAPMYSEKIWLPQDGDKVQALARYGKRIPVTPTQPTPNVPTNGSQPNIRVTIEDLTGRTWKSTKIEWE